MSERAQRPAGPLRYAGEPQRHPLSAQTRAAARGCPCARRAHGRDSARAGWGAAVRGGGAGPRRRHPRPQRLAPSARRARGERTGPATGAGTRGGARLLHLVPERQSRGKGPPDPAPPRVPAQGQSAAATRRRGGCDRRPEEPGPGCGAGPRAHRQSLHRAGVRAAFDRSQPQNAAGQAAAYRTAPARTSRPEPHAERSPQRLEQHPHGADRRVADRGATARTAHGRG